MKEQLVQILERERGSGEQWKVRTVIQLWSKREDERTRLLKFMSEDPSEESRCPMTGQQQVF